MSQATWLKTIPIIDGCSSGHANHEIIQINVDKYLEEVALKEEERKKPISTPLERFYYFIKIIKSIVLQF